MTTIRSNREIYRVIEKYLREAEEPLTCVDLMEHADVEEAAREAFGPDKRVQTNQVSNALGLMWRNNLLTRYPAGGEKGTMARYAYTWSAKEEPRRKVPVSPPARSKMGVIIEEREDGIMIEFDKCYVFVRPK